MTYRTPLGIRYLKGAERRLICDGIWGASDSILEDECGQCEFRSSVAVFENLEHIEKQLALLRISQALLTDTGNRVLRRAAYLEGAIAAVYEFIVTRIEVEIDSERNEVNSNSGLEEDVFYWRELTHQAAIETKLVSKPPRVESRRRKEWDFTLSCLLDRILGDSDYQATYLMDSAPAKTKALMQMLGMKRNYFLIVPKVPRGETVESIRREIIAISTADLDIPF